MKYYYQNTIMLLSNTKYYLSQCEKLFLKYRVLFFTIQNIFLVNVQEIIFRSTIYYFSKYIIFFLAIQHNTFRNATNNFLQYGNDILRHTKCHFLHNTKYYVIIQSTTCHNAIFSRNTGYNFSFRNMTIHNT